METMDDLALLHEYAAHGSETAFETLVSRRVGFVYSAALRQVRDPHLAEEITQAVFIILAQKAGKLSDKTILTGWFFKTTRFAALAQTRAAAKRLLRTATIEKEFQMQSESTVSDLIWEQMSPLLDEALASLGETDRQAVLLRFFENKSLAEVGNHLATSEDTARKRVTRALEKLRKYFSKRGVDSTAASIGGALSVNSVHAAPVALAKAVTVVAVAKGAAASVSTLTLIKGALKIMAWTNAKSAIAAGAVILLAVGTTSTIAIANSNARKTEKLWRINKPLTPAQIDKLPPIFSILPTKFVDSPWFDLGVGTNNDKFVCANVRAGWIADFAYAFPRGRIQFATEEPTNCFDFAATLPQGSREALRQWLKTKLGLVGHRETNDMDVLLLRVKYPNAPGLQPAIPGKSDQYSKPGAYHSSNEAIDTGAPRFEGLAEFLEIYFKMPTIDQTGLTQRFSIDLRWREQKFRDNPDGLKQNLLDRLGLELVPAKMPVEILVMDKAR
jgi:uncharacterized protein (TIGR03435 family)